MNELEQYILSTFNKAINIDSVQFSTNQYLCKLNKNLYKVFITPIKIPELKKFQAKYNSLVINALNMWSQALFETDIKFEIINTPHKADIKLYWGKVNINYAGMQYYEQNAGLKTLCVCIGLITPDKIVLSDEDVFHVILHEFGHILGLGHSPNPLDIMSPSGIYATEFSENDRIVLNLIYSIKENKTYKECEKIIFEYIQSFGKVPQKINCNQKKIIYNISNFSSSRLLILYQQPLKSISQKINSYKICKTYDYINELLNA